MAICHGKKDAYLNIENSWQGGFLLDILACRAIGTKGDLLKKLKEEDL